MEADCSDASQAAPVAVGVDSHATSSTAAPVEDMVHFRQLNHQTLMRTRREEQILKQLDQANFELKSQRLMREELETTVNKLRFLCSTAKERINTAFSKMTLLETKLSTAEDKIQELTHTITEHTLINRSLEQEVDALRAELANATCRELRFQESMEVGHNVQALSVLADIAFKLCKRVETIAHNSVPSGTSLNLPTAQVVDAIQNLQHDLRRQSSRFVLHIPESSYPSSPTGYQTRPRSPPKVLQSPYPEASYDVQNLSDPSSPQSDPISHRVRSPPSPCGSLSPMSKKSRGSTTPHSTSPFVSHSLVVHQVHPESPTDFIPVDTTSDSSSFQDALVSFPVPKVNDVSTSPHCEIPPSSSCVPTSHDTPSRHHAFHYALADVHKQYALLSNHKQRGQRLKRDASSPLEAVACQLSLQSSDQQKSKKIRTTPSTTCRVKGQKIKLPQTKQYFCRRQMTCRMNGATLL